MKKYYNDAFVGNKNMIASFSKYGELLRLYYPLPDYRQYSDYFHVGLKINDSNIIYLHNDPNNRYNQYYTKDTNILNTEIENTYFNLKIKQTDCVMINQDLFIKKYVFENASKIDLAINFLVHAKAVSSFNNMAGGLILDDSLIQYSHNFTRAIFSKQKLLSHQLNDSERTISSGTVYDKDYIGMSSDSSISYDLGVLKPGEKTEFSILMYMKYDEEFQVEDIQQEIEKFRKINVNKEIEKIEKYWLKFLAEHDKLKFKAADPEYEEALRKIYNRTILFLPLLMNEKTGGISASLEVDEDRDNSGRYAYCWPRDAIWIYYNIDRLGFIDISKKFYDTFLKKTQCKNGMWEQRFYTDGRLAPCWGYQIDETAMVIWGAYEHYKAVEKITGKKDKKFLKDNLKMFEKAIDFLLKYINYIMGKEETEDKVRMQLEKEYNYKDRDAIYKHPSFDLWEMNEGVHLYSVSAIYAAFNSMSKIYDELFDLYEKNRLKQDSIITRKKKYAETNRNIKQFIMDNLYDKQRKVLLRNTNDRKVDISVLGAIYPFGVFEKNDVVVKNTIEQINMTLRTYLGGYLRFQDDTYMGGKNPWIISTAWMGMYYKKIRDKKEAQECLNFIVKSATNLGLLSEQTSSNLTDRWVVGLAWSHAMFIGLLAN